MINNYSNKPMSSPGLTGGSISHRRWIPAFAGMTVLFILSACNSSKPPLQIIPDMDDQKKVKAQSGVPREPVSGTVARNQRPYPFKTDPESAGQKLKNPLTPTQDILNRGQFVYNVHCLPCHNSDGQGFGPVVKKGFAPPPPLSSEKVINWTDGRVFHVITMGQGIMPAYGPQIDPIDRWSIVLYLKALQKIKNSSKNQETTTHDHSTH